MFNALLCYPSVSPSSVDSKTILEVQIEVLKKEGKIRTGTELKKCFISVHSTYDVNLTSFLLLHKQLCFHHCQHLFQINLKESRMKDSNRETVGHFFQKLQSWDLLELWQKQKKQQHFYSLNILVTLLYVLILPSIFTCPCLFHLCALLSINTHMLPSITLILMRIISFATSWITSHTSQEFWSGG